MKKYSYFLSLLLFFVAGVANVQAQYYEPGYELDNMDQIVGNPVFVRTNTQEAETYMCGTKGATRVTDDCLMMFEEVEGLQADGHKCYRLKQVSTGKYIKDYSLQGEVDSSDSPQEDADPFVATTDNVAEALVFTALLYEEGTDDVRKKASSWQVQDDRNHGYIFTRAQLRDNGLPTYLGFYSGNPFFSPWDDTNVWTIWEANEITDLASVLQGFMALYFPNDVDESEFPYGNNPGQYNQEAYENAAKVYEGAFQASNDPAGLTKEIVQEWANKLAAAKAALVVNPLVEGYYYISDSRSPAVYYLYNDNAEASKSKFLMSEAVTLPEIPEAEFAQYIWHITAGEEAGQWFFENFKTGKRVCNTTESTGVTAFTVNADGNAFKVEAAPSGAAFIIMRATDDSQWNTAVNQGKYICVWNDKNDAGNKFQFYTLDAESVAALEEAVKQQALNKSLEELYNTANATYAGSRKFSGAPEGESFGDAADNLVTDAAVLESNAVATNEGALANLLDGDYTTYFHTAWQAADGPDPATWHYVQADLGEPVSALALKYARRSQNPNGCNPTLIQVLSTNDPASEEWTDNGTFTMTYTIDATIGGNVSQNFIGTCGFELAEPARYVRLLVKDRINGTSSELLAGYPFWYLSELHFYNGVYDPENSPFELVPANVRDALAEQLANAKDELLTGEATQATLDALKAAYEAFLAQLPDSKRVTDAIAAAQAYHDAAPASEEAAPGYFPAEAKTAFQTAIDNASGAIGDNMTLNEINTIIETLEAATATFKASLYLPTVGSYYIIRSMSETYNQAMVYANTTATTGGIRFRSQVAASEEEGAGKTDAVDWKDHPNYVWYVEAAANGKVTLRNVLTGRYFAFQDTKNNGVQQSVTPVEVPVQSALIEGGVNFVVGEGLYANTAGGGLVVAWDSANGADNSAFGFEEVQSGNFDIDGEFMWGVQSGKPQVITLPVAVSSFNGGKAYKFLGENAENEFVFEGISSVDAGIPFLFVAEADLENGEAAFYLENAIGDEMPEYATVAQEQNGMQGTFEGLSVDAGCGVFWGGSFMITTSNSAEYLKNVGANSGYFNGKHPKDVTAEGDYKFKAYGTVDSINQIVAGDSEAPVNVYNLSGVLVRQNVKAGQATNGLAKGLYIVNGKKLFVK